MESVESLTCVLLKKGSSELRVYEMEQLQEKQGLTERPLPSPTCCTTAVSNPLGGPGPPCQGDGRQDTALT